MGNNGAQARWQRGCAPVAVVMISLNEAHNMESVCRNLAGWAAEVFLVDSYSKDETIDIALQHGIHVVQRRFRGFGDQWNFALSNLSISSAWTMKLDPDERLTEELKRSIMKATEREDVDGVSMHRRLWFMNRRLPVYQKLVRVWRTGNCKFSDVAVNEHPVVGGRIVHATGELEHHDSPDLTHWIDKQNAYTSSEALAMFSESPMADTPRLIGTPLQRRMFLKKAFFRIPFRYSLLFLYNWLWLGAWRAGWVGFAWARLRSDVERLIDYKRREMVIRGNPAAARSLGPGGPDERVEQFD